MSASEFEAGWRTIPLGLRLLAWTLMPVYAIGMLLFGSREMVARHAEVDDLPSRADVETASDEHMAPFRQVVLADRDAHLQAALERIHADARESGYAVPLQGGVVVAAQVGYSPHLA